MSDVFISKLSAPSSTITASTLAGLAMTVGWELLGQFGWEPRPTLVASSVTLVSALIGYFKRENILPIAPPSPQAKAVETE